MEKHNIDYNQIGRLEVGTESMVDRSKSIKTYLMRHFEESGNNNLEGVDTYNACYGGTAALLNCMNWLTSLSWDGRWAVTVATDIADSPAGYRFMTGCASVALLVGLVRTHLVDTLSAM